MKKSECKKIIESLIFSSPNPISIKQLKDFFSEEEQAYDNQIDRIKNLAFYQ